MGVMTHADRHDRERWIASGLPDAVVTIMFRDGTLPPPHAGRWYDSSLTTEEITTFRRAGRQAPDAAFAASLEARGLPTDLAFIETWDGFAAERILEAIDRGFTSGAQFAPWASTDADVTEVELLAPLASFDGFDPRKALAQLRAGRSQEEIGFALEAGLKPKQASTWISRGLSASTAAAWSRAGFSASKAAAWIEVVDDPEVAHLLQTLDIDVDAAREQRPEGGWTPHVVRRHVAIDAGASEDTADEWAATSLPDRKLARWVAAGVRPGDTSAWRELDFRPSEAAAWAAQGFAPADADVWRRTGVDPEVAARRRGAGVRPARSVAAD
jgi:hypothetical protein